MLEINNIYHGDYKELIKSVDDKSIDLVLTDPPYLFVKGGMSSKNLNRGTKSSDNYINTDMSDFGEKEINTLLDNLAPKFRNGWNSYFFCSEKQVACYLKYAIEHNIKYNLLVWDRQLSNMISYKFFRSHIDYIIRLYEGNGLNKVVSDNPTYLYGKIKVGVKDKTYHPTGKPIDMLKDFIYLSSNEGDVVLDPFCGGGAVAIACIRENRNFIGFEINGEYYQKAIERIDKEMHPACLVSIGEPCNETTGHIQKETQQDKLF